MKTIFYLTILCLLVAAVCAQNNRRKQTPKKQLKRLLDRLDRICEDDGQFGEKVEEWLEKQVPELEPPCDGDQAQDDDDCKKEKKKRLKDLYRRLTKFVEKLQEAKNKAQESGEEFKCELPVDQEEMFSALLMKVNETCGQEFTKNITDWLKSMKSDDKDSDSGPQQDLRGDNRGDKDSRKSEKKMFKKVVMVLMKILETYNSTNVCEMPEMEKGRDEIFEEMVKDLLSNLTALCGEEFLANVTREYEWEMGMGGNESNSEETPGVRRPDSGDDNNENDDDERSERKDRKKMYKKRVEIIEYILKTIRENGDVCQLPEPKFPPKDNGNSGPRN